MGDSSEQSEESGAQRLAQSIEVKYAAPSDSPTLNDLLTDFDKISDELEGRISKSSDYGEMMLWHRRLDVVLTKAIRAKFAPKTKSAADDLLEYPGGLAFFAARVKLGRCMGLYDDITYADLKIINDIRNAAAHPKDDNSSDLELFGFDNPWVIERCSKLRFLESSPMTKDAEWPTSARERYEKSTALISAGLWSQYLIPAGWSDGKHPPWPGLLP